MDFAPAAERDLKRAEALGLAEAPICIAKTHLSLSADPALGGLDLSVLVAFIALQAINYLLGDLFGQLWWMI